MRSMPCTTRSTAETINLPACSLACSNCSIWALPRENSRVAWSSSSRSCTSARSASCSTRGSISRNVLRAARRKRSSASERSSVAERSAASGLEPLPERGGTPSVGGTAPGACAAAAAAAAASLAREELVLGFVLMTAHSRGKTDANSAPVANTRASGLSISPRCLIEAIMHAVPA
jgi:hypothetical protein